MILDDLAAPFRYREAKANRERAYAAYNGASLALELATIKERFAELYSQWEPVNEIKNLDLEEREKLCASAYYIIYGRLPKKEAQP